jgi:AraC-like DNA-binding protein
MANPVVLHANHFQFAPGQELENPCVSSRMLLWCRQGLGTVEVDGRACPLAADAWLLLPWRHRVRYRADRRRPFLVGGIHLCPDHDPALAVELRVPHAAADPLAAAAHRRDAPWPGLAGVAGGSGAGAGQVRLRDLAEWVVARWTAAPVDAGQARAMAELLVAELQAALAPGADAALPAGLAQALRLVRADLARPQDLATLARAAGCSPATLVRLFRGHLQRSPMAWLRSERVEAARRLLASGALPVAEIGRRVGIPDPQRFCRVFQAATGMPPRQWRQRCQL